MTSAPWSLETEASPATDEAAHTTNEEEARPAAEAESDARRAAENGKTTRLLEELIQRVGGEAGAKAVFSEPIERSNLTVVPVARVRWGVGGGSGTGAMGPKGQPTGSGSGGAGGVTADPVGYLEIGSSGARFRAIPQLPSAGFILASGFTAVFIIRALGRLIRR
jgi:uncharacterized spore protein YtfJ